MRQDWSGDISFGNFILWIHPTVILLKIIHDIWIMSCLFHDILVSRHPQILVTNTARRLVVIDVERGDQELCYDNCEFCALELRRCLL